MITGPTKKKLLEFERKMTSVYPIKAKIISYGSLKNMKTLNRRFALGKSEELFISTIPDTLTHS